ncbi:MFS transporter [Deinococcus planocerae]|uniref:MFS transporter n=1 Tax=Deinococcus planocerae TaxID=1737569 RepID=UPI000C7F5586|nr:MFS transporter [Deinococcus planocerae]
MRAWRAGPTFRRLWLASTSANIGDGIGRAALPLLVASVSRDPIVVASLSAFAALPGLVFTLPFGALIDRLDRRTLLVLAHMSRGLLLGLLALAVLTGHLHVALLYGVAFVLGTAETLADGTAETLVPSLVGSDHLEDAGGALYATSVTSNEFVGPPLGGLLFAAFPGLPFLVNALSFLGSTALISTLPSRPARRGVMRESWWREVVEGLRWLWSHALLRSVALLMALTTLLDAAVFALFVLFATALPGVGPVGYGLLLTAGAVGHILGSLLSPSFSRRFGAGRTVLGSVFVLGLVYLGLSLLHAPPLLAALLVIDGLNLGLSGVVKVALRQRLVPSELRGRVGGAYRFIVAGAAPLGALLGGVLGQTLGLRGTFAMAGGLALVVAVLFVDRVNNRAVACAQERVDGQTSASA